MKDWKGAPDPIEEAARAVLLDAERAWEVELRSVFGTRAFEARLLSGRSGEPGSALRGAYLAYMKAVRRWDEVAPPGLMVPSIYRPEKIKPREVKSRKKTPSPETNLRGDGESAIVECLAAGKPFVFDPATNFLHADDGTVEVGIRYLPAPSTHVALLEQLRERIGDTYDRGDVSLSALSEWCTMIDRALATTEGSTDG